MPGQNPHDNREAQWLTVLQGGFMKALGIGAVITTMTYVLLAASQELHAFAPIPMVSTLPYIWAVPSGFVAYIVTIGLVPSWQISILALVVVVPPVAYGVSLVTAWTIVGGRDLLTLFVHNASNQVLALIMTVGLLTIMGMIIGLVYASRILQDRL